MNKPITGWHLLIGAAILFALYYIWVAVLPSTGKAPVIYSEPTNAIQGTKVN